ncbi:MAG TPA: hypothetical protein VD838_15115 [Anaeromyxobacteraceae bacterium]|nr:hypothetical protein [Anaeromyxobacteraceae bacterium]
MSTSHAVVRIHLDAPEGLPRALVTLNTLDATGPSTVLAGLGVAATAPGAVRAAVRAARARRSRT